MIRVGICDDSPAFLLQTKFMLDHWDDRPTPITTECFEDGDSLIRAHSRQPFDLLLLDVMMPLLNGIDTAKEIREQDKTVKIVFLTSSTDFAIDSYAVKASNYLLKPLHPPSFFACLQEVIGEIQDAERCVLIHSNNATHRVRLSNIAYAEAQNKHVLFMLADGTRLSTPEPLYAFEEILLPEDGFFKCHRSFVLNVRHIDSYTHKEIQMRTGQQIPISRRYQKTFEDTYFSLLFRKAGDRA